MLPHLFFRRFLYFFISIGLGFNSFSQDWTWINGQNTVNTVGVYGLIGIPNALNQPGAREEAATWVDNSGALWMFGGRGYTALSNGLLSDLWKFDPVSRIWTWVSGSDVINQLGIYGTLGTTSSLNRPGARTSPVTWTDNSGNLWLFGGRGFDQYGSLNILNDLWKYDITLNQWTWVGGNNTANQPGLYGLTGVASVTNIPGAREMAAGWKDNAGDLWLFGGRGMGFSTGSGQGVLSDLWKYSVTGNSWTWVKGGNSIGAPGVYGTLGVPSASLAPGGRQGAVSWKDNSGNLWLFGGSGLGLTGTSGYLNDVWKYEILTDTWTWVKGGKLVNRFSLPGKAGVAHPSSRPGGRAQCTAWPGNNNTIYVMGGRGMSVSGGSQLLNDLWVFSTATAEWTYLRGGFTEMAGSYGTQTVTAGSNAPGSGYYRMGWKDLSGNFWLFGGNGRDVNATTGALNELWFLNNCIPGTPVLASSTFSRQNVCTGSSATLNVVSGTNTISWFGSATGTAVLATGTAYITPPLTSALAPTTSYTYYAAATNTCGASFDRLQVVATANSIFPVVTTGAVYTAMVPLPDGSTPPSSFSPWVHNFTDPVPPGGVVIGIDLTCDVVDQGWGGTGAAADMHVADQRVGLPVLQHHVTSHSFTTTAPFPTYVYGGTNTFKMYFAGWSGWQGFISNAHLVIRYQLKPSLPMSACERSNVVLKAYGADTYSWTGGLQDSIPFRPFASQSYTVTGYNRYGCPNSAVQQLNIQASPSVALSSATTICPGQTVTRHVTITGTYHDFIWSTGPSTSSISVSPTVSTLYLAKAVNTITGCVDHSTTKVNVNTFPLVTATTSANDFCAGPSTTLSVRSMTRSALMFNGTDTYVETGENITELGKSDFTIEAWIRTSAYVAQSIVTCGDNNNVWDLGERSFYLDDEGIPAFVGFGGQYIYSDMPVNDGNWHHVAVVWDYDGNASGTGRIYVDGVDRTNTLYQHSGRYLNRGTFKIGAPNRNETTTSFDGLIDDVRIWNVARTALQVASFRNSCLSGNESGLVAYYDFEEGEGSTRLYDRSRNDYHGTLVNFDAETDWKDGYTNCSNPHVSYSWLPGGLTTQSVVVTPLTSTEYSVTITNASLCQSQARVSLTVNPRPVILVNSTAICDGESYLITPSGAATYTFLNSTSLVTPTITSSYSVAGTSSLGCESVAPGVAHVTVNPLPVLSLTGQTTLCLGSVYVQSVSGAASYSWNTGSTSSSISVSPTGMAIYEVTGTSMAGCVSRTSKTVQVVNPPVVTASSGNVCTGDSFTIVPQGAVTYTITDGIAQVPAVVTPTANSSYFVSGTDLNGCVSTSSSVVNILVRPAPLIVVNSEGVCAGEVFTMTPTGASTYTFSTGSPTVIPSASASYTVSGTSVHGCVSQVPAIAHVTVNPVPVISASGGSVCAGSGYSLSPAGASSYTYLSGQGPVSAWVSPQSTTEYSIRGVSAEGCLSSNTAILTLSVVPLPTVSVNSGTVCDGEVFTMLPSGADSYTFSTGASTVIPLGNAAYFVSGSNLQGCVSQQPAIASVTLNPAPVISVNSATICSGSVFTMTPSGAVSYTYSSLSATVAPLVNASYTVIGADASGCLSANSAIADVVVNPSPDLWVLGTQTVCYGESTSLYVTGAGSYTWSPAVSWPASPLSTTIYTVSGSASNLCVSSETVMVTVHSLPVLSLNSGTVCPNTSFTIIPAGAISYTYSGGSNIVTPAVTSSYSVSGTDANGCVTAGPAVTTITVMTTTVSVSGNTLTCAGSAMTLSANGAASYTWNTGENTGQIVTSPTVSGTYSVMGANGQCADTAYISIQVDPSPDVRVSSSASLLCVGESATLTVSGADSYLWNQGSGDTMIVINPGLTASYTVTGTNAYNCSAATVFVQQVSECLGSPEGISAGLLIKLYPNPNQGTFTIETPEGLYMTVRNSIGQLILEKALPEGRNEVLLEEQAKGVYVVELRNAHQARTLKIIKN